MRRLFWLGVGAVAGASGTVWAERRVRAGLEALQPDHVVLAAGRRARGFGRAVADAVVEGRDAMREREAELRDRREGRSVHDHAPSRGTRHASGADRRHAAGSGAGNPTGPAARATRPGSTRRR